MIYREKNVRGKGGKGQDGELYLEIDGGMGRGDITTICSSSWNNFMC